MSINTETNQTTSLVNFEEEISNIESFGDNNLLQNMQSAENAIQELNYTERIWDRSRSQFMLKYLTCNTSSTWRNLRQVSAEVSRKRQALKEAKYAYLKKRTEAEIKREEAENETGAKKKLLEIEAQELEDNAMEMMPKVEGALKEVLSLKQLHDQLKSVVGEINEKKFEEEEIRSNIKKVFAQAVRDMRESGKIKTGNQEFMDQLGISIFSAIRHIEEFFNQETETPTLNNSLFHSFLNDMADKYENVIEINSNLIGYDEKFDENLTFDPNED